MEFLLQKYKKKLKCFLLTLCCICRGAYSQQRSEGKQHHLHDYSKIKSQLLWRIVFWQRKSAGSTRESRAFTHTGAEGALYHDKMVTKETISTNGSDYTKIMNYASITQPSRIDKRFLSNDMSERDGKYQFGTKNLARFCVPRPTVEFFLVFLMKFSCNRSFQALFWIENCI